jgi:hypothetical protein
VGLSRKVLFSSNITHSTVREYSTKCGWYPVPLRGEELFLPEIATVQGEGAQPVLLETVQENAGILSGINLGGNAGIYSRPGKWGGSF